MDKFDRLLAYSVGISPRNMDKQDYFFTNKGLELAVKYYTTKYQANISLPSNKNFNYFSYINFGFFVANVDDSQSLLSDIRNLAKEKENYRHAFLFADSSQINSIVYIKEKDKECLLYTTPLNINQRTASKLQETTNIQVYATKLPLHADNPPFYPDAIFFCRDTTAIDPTTEQYYIPDLLASLESTATQSNDTYSNTILPNKLLETSETTNDVIPKEIELAYIIEIQFYLDQIASDLGELFTEALRKSFIEEAKKILTEQDLPKSGKEWIGLYDFATKFIESFKKYLSLSNIIDLPIDEIKDKFAKLNLTENTINNLINIVVELHKGGVSKKDLSNIFNKLMKLNDLNSFIQTITSVPEKITAQFITKLLNDKEPEKLAKFLIDLKIIDSLNSNNEEIITKKIELITNLDISESTKNQFNSSSGFRFEVILWIISTLNNYNQLDFKILEILINTPEKQLNLLLGNTCEMLSSNKLSECNLPIIAIHMLMNDAIKFNKYQNQSKSPSSIDGESSMKDDKVKQANEKFTALQKKFSQQLEEPNGLEKIELQIRKKLLETIKESAEPATPIHDFLTPENIEAIALQTNKELLKTSRELFTSNDDLAQIAWRAYDPGSSTVGWPNLLTAPKSSSATETVFTTRESTAGMREAGATTLGDTSFHARTYAALCFLATQDVRISRETNKEICSAQNRQEMWEDFISYIAEVRRAHNENTAGTDNPSCFPGTISRIAQSVNKHAEFSTKESLSDAISNSIRAYVDVKLAQALNQLKSIEDKQKLYYSLIMLGLNNAKDIIDNPSSILTILPIDNVDSLTEFEKQKIIQEYIKIRGEFLASLGEFHDEEHPGLIPYVFNYLKKHHIDTSNPIKMRYLIEHTLASLPSLGISLNEELKKSMLQEDMPSRKEDASYKQALQGIEQSFLEEGSLLSWPKPDESAKNLTDITTALQYYWIPLFKTSEYEALMSIFNDSNLCEKIVEERFSGFSLRQEPTLNKLLAHLKEKDNYQILVELNLEDTNQIEINNDLLMPYSISITAKLQELNYNSAASSSSASSKITTEKDIIAKPNSSPSQPKSR